MAEFFACALITTSFPAFLYFFICYVAAIESFYQCLAAIAFKQQHHDYKLFVY